MLLCFSCSNKLNLHDELYGYLQRDEKMLSSENRLDNWFLSNTSIRKTKTWIPVIDGQEGKPKAVTLQRYISKFYPSPREHQEPEVHAYRAEALNRRDAFMPVILK